MLKATTLNQVTHDNQADPESKGRLKQQVDITENFLFYGIKLISTAGTIFCLLLFARHLISRLKVHFARLFLIIRGKRNAQNKLC